MLVDSNAKTVGMIRAPLVPIVTIPTAGRSVPDVQSLSRAVSHQPEPPEPENRQAESEDLLAQSESERIPTTVEPEHPPPQVESENHSPQSASNHPLPGTESENTPVPENDPPQQQTRKGKEKEKQGGNEWYHRAGSVWSLPPSIPSVFGLPRSSIFRQLAQSDVLGPSGASARDVEMAPPDRRMEPVPIASPPARVASESSSRRPSGSSRTKGYDADDEDGRGDDRDNDQVLLSLFLSRAAHRL